MSRKKGQDVSPAPAEEDRDDLITLMDEDGGRVEFELLDLITYSADTYAVLVPVDDDTDQVVIFRVENPDSENNTFIPVTDQSLAMAIFHLFKEKNRDLYDFEDD